MKSRLLGVGVLVLLLNLLVTGFAKKSVVGKWKENVSLPSGHGSISTVIEYKPDGTELTWAQVGPETAIATSKYTVKDNMITATIFSISRNGLPVPLSSKMTKPQTATFKIDGDNLLLTLSNSTQIVTLTRVKS